MASTTGTFSLERAFELSRTFIQ